MNRPGDQEIAASDLRVGDEIHLTVMGGDEYFTVENIFAKGIAVYWRAVGVAVVEDIVAYNHPMWVRKRAA